MKQIKELLKAHCTIENGKWVFKLVDINAACAEIAAMEDYRSQSPAAGVDVRAVGEGKFYKLIADYIGNTQPIGYTFKSVIGEYYDKFPANFCRISEKEYEDSTLTGGKP